MIFDDRGTLIVEHLWPAPGVKYVGNGKPRGPEEGVSVTDVLRHRSVTDVLMQNCHPCPETSQSVRGMRSKYPMQWLRVRPCARRCVPCVERVGG